MSAVRLVAAIGVYLVAALRAVMADRAANRGAKHAVVPGDMAGNAASQLPSSTRAYIMPACHHVRT